MFAAAWISELSELPQQQRILEDALDWFDEEGFQRGRMLLVWIV